MKGKDPLCEEVQRLFPEVVECEAEPDDDATALRLATEDADDGLLVPVRHDEAEACSRGERCAPVAVRILAELDGHGSEGGSRGRGGGDQERGGSASAERDRGSSATEEGASSS